MENPLPTEVVTQKPVVEDNPFPAQIGINSGPAQGRDVVGGLVATNEARLNQEADQTGFIDTTKAAFRSGGNMAVQVYKRLEREAISPPPDPNFDVEAFIKAKKGIIPQHLEHKVRLADSEFEGELVVQDMLSDLKDQDMLARRTGVSTSVAQGLAGIVDLDTPFAMGMGAAFKGGMAATKWGRFASGVSQGAIIGGASLAAGELVSVEAGTTGDWTSIPAAGLAGMAFGGVFGAFGNGARKVLPEDAANASMHTARQEFDDFATHGGKMEERDIRTEQHTHEDVYQTNKIADDKLMAELQPEAPPTPEARTAKLEKEMQGQRDRDVYAGLDGLDPELNTDVRYALDIATGVTVSLDKATRAMKAAVDSGRDDIADELIARMERKAKTQSVEPGVPVGHAKYDAIKENLLRLKEEAAAEVEQLKNLRKLQEEEAAKKPRVFRIEDLEPTRPDSVGEVNQVFGEGSSVGARQMNPQGSTATITNGRSTAMIQAGKAWAATSGVVSDYFAKEGNLGRNSTAGSFIERQANRFHDAVVSTGLATDFDRLFRSGSIVAQKLAYDTAESASGIVRNNRSAAMLTEHHQKQLLGTFMPAYEDSFNAYARQAGFSWYDRMFDSSIRNKFNTELALELNARMYDPKAPRTVSKAVRDAADAMDKWSALEIEVGRGRPGETPVKGYDQLQAQSGYMPQRWSSKKMEDLIRAGRKEKDIINAVSETYKRMHPGMTADDAKVYAGAVVKRARAMGQGIDTNLIGMLQQDGRDFVEDMLRRNGVSAADASAVIDRLTSNAAVRGQAGQTKGRIDVDMRMQSSNGIKMIDLFDTDFVQMISRRSRGTAGNAALARKGIASRTDRLDVIQAILDEQAAKGPSQKTGTTVREKLADAIDEDKHLTREDLEHYFSYFDGGPVAGGLSPVYSNMKKLTNLALLNGLGVTQLGETGAMIGAVGIKKWWEHAGAAVRSAANDPKSALVQELKHINVLVPEERLFRPDLNIEMDKVGTAQSELAMKISTMLNQGQRIQGVTSGFYAARNIQQRIAVTSAADKIMTGMKNQNWNTERMADIGLDNKLMHEIKQYVDNGTVEFKDGSLYKLNFDKWSPDHVEDFALSLNRSVHQLVQKAMIGEDNILFHRDGIASLFFHLKSFPMLAMEKQALRHMKMADNEAVAVFLYGLATAATVYSAKQTLAGKTDDATDPVKIAKGAFGMSNMTGWIPMWSDPVAGMFGLDSMKFNEYNRGINQNIISVPPTLTTMNRMLQIPGAAIDLATGNHTNSDIRALQSLPIIGNAYGFTYMFNSMKSTPAEKRAKKKAAKEAADPAQEEVAASPLDEMVNDITE